MTTEAERPGLRVENLVVRFGGCLAVNDVTLEASGGALTGLIGPNGAGKTTIFNACTGVVPTASGRVTLGDRDLSRHGPAARAQVGLGRTFQRMELYDSMTVEENVALGPEAAFAGHRPWAQLFSTARERREVSAAMEAAIERCGITDLRRRPVRDLSTGQRRLVELARAVASPFRFLLLDEPSSGLDPAESENFGAILVDVVASGTGILLVEHDMTLVRAVCEHVYVLDFGQLIFEGSMADALTSDIVRAAYLGSEAA